MQHFILGIVIIWLSFESSAGVNNLDEFYYKYVKEKAVWLVEKYGFNAGSGYSQTWIRDFNTFIELALNCSNIPYETVRKNLTVFFGFQDEENGFNTIDGFNAPDHELSAGQDRRYSKYFPGYVGFKNTVEIDQETSLIQSVYKYVKITQDLSIFDVEFGNYSVKERMEFTLQGLLTMKYDANFGLLYSATRADWGDIQPEGIIGSWITNKTHWSICIYDNAMFVIAVRNFIELFPEKKDIWEPILKNFTMNIRKYLWNSEKMKFIPHIYLKRGSPFPSSFKEDDLYYFGGTGIAIEADILDTSEIKSTILQMRDNVDRAGAASVGLTIYPAYPLFYFKNPSMTPYSYQNGGDWSWFGGRIVQQLIKFGFVEEAKEFLHPMVERVFEIGEFFEWYTRDNTPSGSGNFKGSAGVLWKAIRMMEEIRNVGE